MIRTFIAIHVEPAGELRGVLAELAGLGASVRVVGEAQLQVTLRFLGAIEPGQVGEAEAALRAAAAGMAAFDLRIAGLGAFPGPRRARVVWARLHGAETAGDIAQRLDQELEGRHFPPRDRAWSPHLTLARVKAKPPRALVSMIEEHRDAPLGVQAVKAVELYRSDLTRSGAVHQVVARVGLGGF